MHSKQITQEKEDWGVIALLSNASMSILSIMENSVSQLHHIQNSNNS